MTSVQIRISKVYRGYRALHGVEGGYQGNPIGMPAVRPSVNAPPIDITEEMQWLIYNLNEGRLLPLKFRQLLDSEVAFTNNQSWEEEVRADFINKRDTNAEFPKLMKAIIMGGWLYNMRPQGDVLIAEPGISAIDVNKPLPDIATIKKNKWYFHCVTNGKQIYNFTNCGIGVPVLMPYFLKEPVTYPIEWFQKWERNYFPDPLRFYV